MACSSTNQSKFDIFSELIAGYGHILDSQLIQDVVGRNKYDIYKSRQVLEKMAKNKCLNEENYIGTSEIHAAIDDVKKFHKILILLRGLPGSGKSYLALNILRATRLQTDESDHIFSTDNFFMKRGVYTYDPQKISEAHNWTQRSVFQKMLKGYSPLIIDNTNTEMWEMLPYARMATQCGYKIHIVEAKTKWWMDLNELSKRNKHGVSKNKIRAMSERYQRSLTPEILLNLNNLTLAYQNSPQMRDYPPIIKENPPEPLQNVELNSNSSTDKYGFSPYNFDKSLWGVDEEKLKSWNIVKALNCESASSRNVGINPKCWGGSIPNLETHDQSCNTDLYDFYRQFDDEDNNIIMAKPREINGETLLKLGCVKPGFLDKSVWTQEDSTADQAEDLEKLYTLFPNVPQSYVSEIYERCHQNFDLTMEIFLEDNTDYTNLQGNVETSPNRSDIAQIINAESTQNCVENAGDNAESTTAPQIAKFECVPTTSTHTGSEENYVIVNGGSECFDSDSDLEFDQFEASSSNKSEENEFIELNLGQHLVDSLEREFGDDEIDHPKGFQPVVQIPKTFARQLYAFYIESVYQQMETQKIILDKLVKEDEAFAKKLLEEETVDVGGGASSNLDFKEIMNEQAAQAIYLKEIEQMKTIQPDDLATILTKKKLTQSFPTVDPAVLVEIYTANGRNYEQTVEDLLVQVEPGDIRSVDNFKEAPIDAEIVSELKNASELYGNSIKNDENEFLNRSSQSFRDEANEYLRKRKELYAKAQEYFSKRLTEVAQFYLQLAKKQTQFYDMANSRAATVLLEEHSRRLQNFDTLDLHFLFVKEAIPALDLFIDRNINLLRGSKKNSQNLLVITGRGNRSKDGLSKIKPAVISRLRKRKIQYAQMNPGLLKIKLNKNTTTTSDLQNS